MIDFGATLGSSEAGRNVRPFIKELFEIFYENKSEVTYFKNLEKFHIIFLVSGKNKDYLSEGVEGLQKIRGKNILVIYFSIPENRWKDVSIKDFRCYLSKAVCDCFKELYAKARAMNEILDEEQLLFDFNEGIDVFRACRACK